MKQFYPRSIAWLCAICVSTALATTVSDITGEGSAESPYQITSLNDLRWLSEDSSEWSGKYFIQTADIDASGTKDWNDGAGFSPIGSRTTNFSGHYNGEGHVITGLYIDRDRVDVGLFGHLSGATVDSLGVIDAYVSSEGEEVAGILAGYNNNGSTISDCFSSGTLVGAKFAGGLVGKDLYSSIVRSYSTADVSGGLYVGGLLGETNHSTIANTYSTGTVTGESVAGGLIGHIYINSSVSNSYSTGSVSADSYPGGLSGEVEYPDSVKNCFWNTETSGQSSTFGWIGSDSSDASSGLTTEQMKVADNFTDWDFDAIWSIGSNTYPVLQSVSDNAPFAFEDPLTGLAHISFAGILSNDYDYEDGQTGLAYKVISQTEHFGTFDDSSYTFTVADSAATDTLVYCVGELLSGGDTLWGNRAQVFLTKAGRGDGTEENPYEISTLQLLRNVSEDSSVWDSHFIQTADIDAADTKNWNDGSGFTPIGNSTDYFTGTYNGKGHTISNLSILRSSSAQIGLFGHAENAAFDSIGLVNVNIEGGYYTGSLVGYASSDSISDCYSTGSLEGKANVGGLVGRCESSTSSILRSHNKATVTGSAGSTGGLAGYSEASITRCYNQGDVSGTILVGGLVGFAKSSPGITESYSTGNVSGESDVGGLAGEASSSPISLCYATGALSGTSHYIGGLVGLSLNSSISSSYATGAVSGVSYVGGLVGDQRGASTSGSYSTGLVSGTDSVGGFIGHNNASSTVSGSYWNTETSGDSAAIGVDDNEQSVTGLTTEEMRTRSTLSVYDFIKTWSLRADSTYPVLDSVSNNAPFAFADVFETTAPISLDSVLANDWDYETLQASLAYQTLNVTEHYGSLSDGVFTFNSGTTYGSSDTLLYRVGEVIAEGDTLWGNNAGAVFVYQNNAPVLSSVSDSIVIVVGDTLVLSLDDVSASDVDGDVLSLQLYSGENYSVKGDSVIPSDGYSGTLKVAVAVTDGGATSAVDTMVIRVDAVPEVASAIADIETDEDAQLESISLSSVFSDADDTELSYTAKSLDTTLVTTFVSESGALSLTLRPDSSGNTEIVVTATDGYFSVSDTFAVTVAAVNDAPVITSVKTDTTNENTSLELTIADVTVTDVDNDAENLSLVVKSGTNYTVNGDTVTPDEDYTGTLKVVVAVTDGQDTSATDTIEVYVKEEGFTAVTTAATSLNRFSSQLMAGKLQLKYSISHTANVSIAFYNLSGAQVLVLREGLQSAGVHDLVGDASGLSAGLYEGVLLLNGSPAAHAGVNIPR